MKLLAVLVFVGLVALAIVGTLEAPIVLIFGWIPFLGRIVPRVTFHWPTVAVGCAAFGLFIGGIHWLGRSWQKHQIPESGAMAPVWKFRWSLMTVSAIILLFTAGLGVIGSVHQLVWLIGSKEPLVVQKLLDHGTNSSINNLKMTGLGLLNYHSTYGKFPPGGSLAPDGGLLHSWETHLLPYIGSYFDRIDRKIPWNDPSNRRYFYSVIPEFINPSFPVESLEDSDGYGLSHYAANVQIMGRNKTISLKDISDDTSTTILAGEVNSHFKPWGHPVNWRDPSRGINVSDDGFGGPKGSGGVNFVMADGSVRFVGNNVSPKVLQALSTPNGGEKIDTSELNP
jgi:prepilin-type processing-associated H-X9-DG protein